MQIVKNDAPKIKLSIYDRAINSVFPAYGMKRVRSKVLVQTLKNTGYIGASTVRTAGRGFDSRGASSDVDDLKDLPALRARARDLYRNNPLGSGALKRTVTNAIGIGLDLQCLIKESILGISSEAARAWETDTENRFKAWAESKHCDQTKTQNFYEMQGLAFLSTLMSGDCFTLLPIANPKKKFVDNNLRLLVVEGDFVENPNMQPDTKRLSGGVQVDANGAPEIYHFAKTHPGASILNSSYGWTEVRAYGRKSGRRNVIHLFDRVRPGQRRGVPLLAPVIEQLHQLGRFTNSELMAAVINSFFTAFIKSQTSEGNILEQTIPDAQKVTNQDNAADAKLMEMGSGNMIQLAEGEDVSFADPKRPNANFDIFFNSIVRQIGAAVEIPFEQLILHFQSSYSAARGAMLEAWKHYRNRRMFTARNWCQPVFEEWLYQEIISGRISAPGFLTDNYRRWAWSSAKWVGSGPGQIDPLKETKASREKIAGNLSDHSTEYTNINGGDWASSMARRSQENKLLEKLGLDNSNETADDETTDDNTIPPVEPPEE